MTDLAETIVAPITGTAPAAVAVIRLSGPDAYPIAARVFAPWPNPVEPWRARYGRFAHGDDGLILPFPDGHGYTGEPAVEMSIHGGRASVEGLLRACWQAGARPARPGEFSLRAFLNGRLDLSQAEGVRETVDALAERQLRSANWARAGGLRHAITDLRERTLGVLAAIEARVDFAEELDELDPALLIAEIGRVAYACAAWVNTAEAGRIVRDGYRVVLAGLPNAGKSSLLNSLLGRDRAIVTDTPGTTRDTLEELLVVEGLPVQLVDTAGLRETDDTVEQLGVERSRTAAAAADCVLLLVDSSQGWTPENQTEWDRLLSVLPAGRLHRIATKADLDPSPQGGVEGPRVSTVTGEGLPEFRTWLAHTLAEHSHLPEHTVGARQAECLARTEDALREAVRVLQAPVPYDLATTFLRDAVERLGEVTGETASPDVVEALFARFCLGK